MLGTLHARDDGRFELCFERRLLHPVAKVWRAITEADQLRAWFPASVDVDPTVGAKLRFDLAPESRTRHGVRDEDMTLYGEVTAADPPRLLEYTWDEEVLRWQLEPIYGGCLLRFTHIVDDRALAAGAGAGWHATFEALDALLGGRPMHRMALFDRADELASTYAGQYGAG
ncbi:MAG TPA: SRPBCC domain-containing protein [Nocardioidaceae bacterium]|nr:SRPBCC domain-containing protein [Nocardioidaceae bacterium]